MKKVIITHAGNAHRDDFLTCCLLLDKYPTIEKIERVYLKSSDRVNEDTLVVDTGGRIDPEKGIYDHHHLPREAEVECALSLVVRHELNALDDFLMTDWFLPSVVSDSKGPLALAALLGLDGIPPGLYSPIEGALLQEFASYNVLYHDDFLFRMMARLGETILNSVKEFATAVGQIEKNANHLVVSPNRTGLFLTDEKINVSALNRYVNNLNRDGGNISFSIMRNNRGPGWVLFRYDESAFDFSVLAYDDHVEFAHANGFLAKVSEHATKDDLVMMVEKAAKV